jgi:hypothetical protein
MRMLSTLAFALATMPMSSATDVFLTKKYSATGCAASTLTEDEYFAPGQCIKVSTGNAAPVIYQKVTCTGARASMELYTSDQCQSSSLRTAATDQCYTTGVARPDPDACKTCSTDKFEKYMCMCVNGGTVNYMIYSDAQCNTTHSEVPSGTTTLPMPAGGCRKENDGTYKKTIWNTGSSNSAVETEYTDETCATATGTRELVMGLDGCVGYKTGMYLKVIGYTAGSCATANTLETEDGGSSGGSPSPSGSQNTTASPSGSHNTATASLAKVQSLCFLPIVLAVLATLA